LFVSFCCHYGPPLLTAVLAYSIAQVQWQWEAFELL
jgi:hypothetical protein